MTISITRDQAKRFILSKQGLLGKYRFVGKDGALRFVRQAGCIQFDPVDVCGKNAELTLFSRVRGFRKKMLEDLLYRDRLLVDYSDKELSIWPREDWPYFAPYRERSRSTEQSFRACLNWSRKPSRISGKTGRSAVTPCRSTAAFSGIPPCTGAGTGTGNPRLHAAFWNSCIRTVFC